MPKFNIIVEEVCHYSIEVEADDEEAAGEEAVEILVQSEDNNEFFIGCMGRVVYTSNKISE